MSDNEIKCPICCKKLGMYNETGVFLKEKGFDAKYIGNHIVVTGKCCNKDLLLEIYTQDNNIIEHNIDELNTVEIDQAFEKLNIYENITRELYSVCEEIRGNELMNIVPNNGLFLKRDILIDKLRRFNNENLLTKLTEIYKNSKILDDKKIYNFNLVLNTFIVTQLKLLKRDFNIVI